MATTATKEEISHMFFPDEEVLADPEEREQRYEALSHGVVLGNTYKGKTKLVFADSQGIRQIETHLWGVTDKRVILKHGIVIPIHRISEVKW